MGRTVNLCPLLRWQRPKLGYRGALHGMSLGSMVGQLVFRLALTCRTLNLNFREWVNDEVRRVSFQSGPRYYRTVRRSPFVPPWFLHRSSLDAFVARAPFATPAEIRPLSACRPGR